jgi:sigma-B regulation protein RsbU (phosphoserine phosphatase)
MKGERPAPGHLPDAALRSIHDLQYTLGVDLRVWSQDGAGALHLLHPVDLGPSRDGPFGPSGPTLSLNRRAGPDLRVEIVGPSPEGLPSDGVLALAARILNRALEVEDEIRFFTYELSERYEEINLLYSISETLGSVLSLNEAARAILSEVCDVLGARRGSLWVFHSGTENLSVVASVGEDGLEGPLRTDDPLAVTAQVFREGRPIILSRTSAALRADTKDDGKPELDELTETVLSVPISYSPPSGEARTVGVINLFGRRGGGRFTASDQKLLSAIASQVGAALENNRLIRESLLRERMAREMELAHNLQMKLVPAVESQDDLEMAARVQPAEQVGGDFYHLIRLPGGRVGVMIGDVSSHGFPAALIMALSMSAATIFAAGAEAPARVLRHMDDALREELETTEMYLTLFYGVLDPSTGALTYSNAGHPHAFVVREDGSSLRLGATDPPVGFAGPEAYHQEVVSTEGKDLLLLFTDGLSDTLAGSDRGSGEERVLEEVARRREQSAGEVVEALFSLAAEVTPQIPADDRTALLLRAGSRGRKP